MGGLVIEVESRCKQVHMKGESWAYGNGQEEAHSGGNIEDEVLEDVDHGRRP